MKLLLIISLILAVAIGTQARVNNDFNNCPEYFYRAHVPSGFQGIAKSDLFDRKKLPDGINVNDLSSPAYICQTFDGSNRFATLYDRGRRMPLYSAYIMDVKASESEKNCKRVNTFRVEPQLAYRGVTENMELVTDAKSGLQKYNWDKKIGERKEENRPMYLLRTSQALDYDYGNTTYDRGHLNPCGHHTVSRDEYKATFTLTNAVPMLPEINQVWSVYENEMINMLTDQKEEIYVITGIVPGNVPIKEGGLSAPTHVWNAYCHVDKNGKPKGVGAALVQNTMGSKIGKFNNIGDFQKKLQDLLGVINIELFSNGCKPEK
ncbi:endonuclease domain-containing 1 protein-like [Anomaloglossus baeobatrachus]|uniref:endonuclease domain-containing 1 protein-like n=1 Tax=Anomaloglossus baeobatrachus TaxID=238106 RepID=UPI003F50649E